MASRTTDPTFAHLSLARAQGKVVASGRTQRRKLRRSKLWCRCSCPPLLPATRRILAHMYMQLPMCVCATAMHPSQQHSSRSLLPGCFRPCSLSGPPPTWRDACGTIELLVHGRAVLPGARPLMVVGGHPSTFLRCAARSRSPPRCRQWRWALLAAVRHQELMCTLRAGYE